MYYNFWIKDLQYAYKFHKYLITQRILCRNSAVFICFYANTFIFSFNKIVVAAE